MDLKANNRIWRGWSIEYVIKEIEKLNLLYGINHFIFHDDYREELFMVESFLKFLKEKRIYWSSDSGFRISKKINDYYMRLWKESNCWNLCFGAETASQCIAEYIEKNIDVNDILRIAELTSKYEIPAKFNWMIGFPTETFYDIKLTLDMIDKILSINPKSSHFVGLYTPYPGTSLFEKSVELGYCPPSSFEKWSILREEITLPFWNKPWYLRCISLVAFFSFVVETKGWAGSSAKSLYKPFVKLLKYTSLLRWQKRFFSLPLEFKFLIGLKNFLRI